MEVKLKKKRSVGFTVRQKLKGYSMKLPGKLYKNTATELLLEVLFKDDLEPFCLRNKIWELIKIDLIDFSDNKL